MAILLAVNWTLHYNFNVAFIFTDCFNAVMQLVGLAGKTQLHYADSFLLRNLHHQLSKLAFFGLTKVDCKDVHLAHCLAKRAMMSSTTSTVASGTPFWTGASFQFGKWFLHFLFWLWHFFSGLLVKKKPHKSFTKGQKRECHDYKKKKERRHKNFTKRQKRKCHNKIK